MAGRGVLGNTPDAAAQWQSTTSMKVGEPSIGRVEVATTGVGAGDGSRTTQTDVVLHLSGITGVGDFRVRGFHRGPDGDDEQTFDVDQVSYLRLTAYGDLERDSLVKALHAAADAIEKQATHVRRLTVWREAPPGTFPDLDEQHRWLTGESD